MKAVIISIQPKWCEKISSGQKTIEVRKTKPKIDTPFKCYIYETKDKKYDNIGVFFYEKNVVFKHGNGKVIGEFTCDNIIPYCAEFCNDNSFAEFVYSPDKDEFGNYEEDVWFPIWERGVETNNEPIKDTCVSYSQLKKYIGIENEEFYGWHISNLKIYDKPKELSEFRKPFPFNKECIECERGGDSFSSEDCSCCEYWSDKDITRPPQSWCYCEELEEKK